MRALRLLAVAVLVACSGGDGPTGAPPADTAALLDGFTLAGDPTAVQGATWTYRATSDGVAYDLRGVLLKPAGSGPFPAVIVSHGFGGSAAGYSRAVGRTMVAWGLVVIATDYTHALGGPAGAPGTTADLGASAANVQRARKLADLLRGLGYVDMGRVAAHGHSMGAFVTTALAGTHPQLLRAASHTAGGVRADFLTAAAPSESQARAVRTPYQLHHGERGVVVSPSAERRLADLLAASGTTHELHVYAGADHNAVALDAMVLARVRAWYARHGVF